MTTPTTDDRCRADLGRCGAYRPGHLLHSIHARLLGEGRHAWQHAVIERLEGRALLLSGRAGNVCAAWHHRLLTDIVEPGTPVLLHQPLHAIVVGQVVVNVRLTGALGADVPAVEGTAAMGPLVVDLSTGRGFTAVG